MGTDLEDTDTIKEIRAMIKEGALLDIEMQEATRDAIKALDDSLEITDAVLDELAVALEEGLEDAHRQAFVFSLIVLCILVVAFAIIIAFLAAAGVV